MPKNIVLLSDGTGNSSSKVWRTNVWRMFQALDLTSSQQVAFYDDGVGTSAFKPLAILGGAFGWGLKRNVLDLYKFLCRNYEPNSNIFAFGFSRGAFTIRVFTGLVADQGLVKYETESQFNRDSMAAYRAYRAKKYHSVFHIETLFRFIRDAVIGAKNLLRGHQTYDPARNTVVPEVRFVGVWDTVAAYGLPIEEMTRGISQWLWPLELPDRTLSKKVRRACHAVALDEERTTFHPVLWTEEGEKLAPAIKGKRHAKDERISQVWFPGVHSNIGGGYPDDSLASIPLVWMMQEAAECGLKFKKAPDTMQAARAAQDKDGRLYDSRQGIGGYYRYGPRKIFELCNMRLSQRPNDAVSIAKPKIHESAFKRSQSGAYVYAPIGIPEIYEVVYDSGEIVSPQASGFEAGEHARRRTAAQERVWNKVWTRRIIYFATVAASIYLALFPVVYQTDPAAEYSSVLRWVAELLRLLSGFLPGFLTIWIDSYAANPGHFLLAVFILSAFIYIGVRLGRSITDTMRGLWAAPANLLPAAPRDPIYWLRTSTGYRLFHSVMKRHVVPLVSVVALAVLVLSVASHVAFNIGDAAGLYCSESSQKKSIPWMGKVTVDVPFRANAVCWASGYEMVEGYRYSVAVRQKGSWTDGSFTADVGGFEVAELTSVWDRLLMYAGVPLRRIMLRPWFRTIVRVGAEGTDEYFLDPDKPVGTKKLTSEVVGSTMTARRSGELFFYVNDAVLPWPLQTELFYRNNGGEAEVTIQQIRR